MGGSRPAESSASRFFRFSFLSSSLTPLPGSSSLLCALWGSAVAQPWAGVFRLFGLSFSCSFFHFYKEYFNGTSRSNHGLCR